MNKIFNDLNLGNIPKIQTILVPTVPITESIIGTIDFPIPRRDPGNRSIHPHKK